VTATQRVKHTRILGPSRHGVPLCSGCQSRTLQSKKRRSSGLCLQCAGGGSPKPLIDCAGAIALRALLSKRGITQAQFAAEIGGNTNLVGKWCRGAWRPQTYWQALLENRYAIPRACWPSKRSFARQRLIEVCPTCGRSLRREARG